MDNKEVVLLKKALDRQKKARIQAEKILEEKSKQLYDASQHLKETNARLESLLNNHDIGIENPFLHITDPFVVMDLQFNVVKCNESAKEFLGYDYTKEVVNLSRLVHVDYRKYTVESFESLMNMGSVQNYRSVIITKDGTEKWVHINAVLIYNEKRIPVGAQGILRDITQEMEIKNIMSRQKQQLDIIVDSSPLGILLVKDGKIIKTNKTIRQMLGYTDQALKYLEETKIFASECTEQTTDKAVDTNPSNADYISVVKKYIRKDGTFFIGKTRINTIADMDGKALYQMAMVEDITEQINLEYQKEQLLLELEASNRGLQEYAHIVSHDLKSPLRSISALATWLNDDYKEVLDENGVYQLRMMQEKVESMDKLIDGILRYSTINSESVDNKMVDVNEVIKEILDIIYIPENVEIVIENELPTIWADRTKVHQLIQNILGNAVVHIERKKGLVTISSIETPTHWQFSITDNGVGIPEKYHEKIFMIFQSIGNKEHSTGIGLSIVKKIIDLYEGKVWLTSTVGEGTTFYFTVKKKS
tara:strand:+ start:1871 stop:3469 length:1599 start_codon:yes stop_codon:yes gene_type:complete